MTNKGLITWIWSGLMVKAPSCPFIRVACKVQREACWSNKAQKMGSGRYRKRTPISALTSLIVLFCNRQINSWLENVLRFKANTYVILVVGILKPMILFGRFFEHLHCQSVLYLEQYAWKNKPSANLYCTYKDAFDNNHHNVIFLRWIDLIVCEKFSNHEQNHSHYHENGRNTKGQWIAVRSTQAGNILP